MANALGTIFLIRISSVSPGSAPLIHTGPVIECGPPPGLARRSLTMSSIVAPGWIALCACIIVSMATVSPESMVTFGGSAGSSQPHCVVCSVAGST